MKNRKLNIKTSNKDYTIIVGTNIFSNFQKYISPHIISNKVFIITDKNISNIFKNKLDTLKKNKKIIIDVIVIGVGENQKSIRNINLICERPKVSKHREKIITSLSNLLNVSEGQINLKGKTVEKLGLIGKEKAIACETIVSLNHYV